MTTPLQTKDEFYADTHNNTDNTLAIPAYHASVNAAELVTEATSGTDTHTRRCLHYTDTLYNKQIGRWQILMMNAFEQDAVTGREGALTGENAVGYTSVGTALAFRFLGTNMSDDRVEAIGAWLVANRYVAFGIESQFASIKASLTDGSVTSKSGQITAAINGEVESVLNDEESRTFMLPTTVGGTATVNVSIVALSETDSSADVYEVTSGRRVDIERDGTTYRRQYDHDNYAVYMVERLSSEGPNEMVEHLVRIDGQATVSIGEYNTARDRVIPRGRIRR